MRSFTLTFFVCLTCLLSSFEVVASLQESLIQGDQAAHHLLEQLKQKKGEAGAHPFYTGQTPPEAHYSEGDLTGRQASALHSSPGAQMIKESFEKRPKFKIDPEKDPLIVQGEKIMKNPLQVIGGEGTKMTSFISGGKEETLTCEEPGEDYLESCKTTLIVKVKHKKVENEWKGQFSFWKEKHSRKKGHQFACIPLRDAVFNRRQNGGNLTDAYKACMQEMGGTLSRNFISLPSLPFKASEITSVQIEKKPPSPKKSTFYYWYYYPREKFIISGFTHSNKHGTNYEFTPSIHIKYEEDVYEIESEEWVSNCASFEEKVDQGLCHYESRSCTQGHQTKVIEGLPVTRDCWEETMTYACSSPSQDDCGPLRARGCSQISATCKETVGKSCVVYTQTYQCKTPSKEGYAIEGGQTPFCMDGNCRDQSWEVNDEMMSSLAQLSLLKEMQGKLNEGAIFQGEDKRCSKYTASFKDCCKSGKGWSKSIGMGGCGADEKALSQKRNAGLCHYVGTYCDKKEKLTGICLEKKSSFCCFNNKLIKAFHEQGRPQISLGWGEPKNPLCRGFTVDELQRIDFSKLDLREAFEDIMKDYTPEKINTVGPHIGQRMEVIKKAMRPQTEKQPPQRNPE